MIINRMKTKLDYRKGIAHNNYKMLNPSHQKLLQKINGDLNTKSMLKLSSKSQEQPYGLWTVHLGFGVLARSPLVL